jgi:hypothetical protein
MRDRKEELEHKLGAVPLRDKASAAAQGEQSAAGRAGA